LTKILDEDFDAMVDIFGCKLRQYDMAKFNKSIKYIRRSLLELNVEDIEPVLLAYIHSESEKEKSHKIFELIADDKKFEESDIHRFISSAVQYYVATYLYSFLKSEKESNIYNQILEVTSLKQTRGIKKK